MATPKRVLVVSAVALGVVGGLTAIVIGATSALADRPGPGGYEIQIQLASPTTGPTEVPPTAPPVDR